MDKKYVVAAGVCLTNGGILYKEGEAVPAGLSEETLKTLISTKKIVEEKGNAPAAKKEEKKADASAKAEEKKPEEKKDGKKSKDAE